MKNIILHCLMFSFLTLSVDDRLLDIQSKRVVSLHDGTTVIILNAVDAPSEYYYLPLDIQIAQNKGVPEISLMIYRNEQNEVTGGILHVLMTWGLTPEQEKEAQMILTQKIDSLGSLKGAGELTFNPGELQFDQNNLYARGLERSSSATIRIPTLPIHKTAASFNLSPLVARFIVDEMAAPDQSDKIRMKASYHYTVTSREDMIRKPVEMQAEIHTSLAVWIKALKKYRLVKVVRV